MHFGEVALPFLFCDIQKDHVFISLRDRAARGFCIANVADHLLDPKGHTRRPPRLV